MVLPMLLSPLLAWSAFMAPHARCGTTSQPSMVLHSMPVASTPSQQHQDHQAERRAMDLAVRKAVVAAEQRRAAAAVLPAMEMIDLTRENAKLQAQVRKAEMASLEQISRLQTENDMLATALRRHTPEHIGFGFGHSMSLSLAHARTALQALASELRFLRIWVLHELQDLRVHLSLVALVWKVRLALRVKKLMASFRPAEEGDAEGSMAADPFAPKQ